MPFSGGGGGQLTAHVHDNTPLQGGPLNFNNTTIAGMGAGDITYSDGNALQTLTYPAVPAGESLQAVALSTAPSWVASAGATVTTQVISPTTYTTYTGLAFTTLTNGTGTLATRAGGKAMLTYFITAELSSTGYFLIRWLIGGSAANKTQVVIGTGATNIGTTASVTEFNDLDGSSLGLQVAMNAGTLTIYNNAASGNTLGMVYEVS